MPLDNGYEQSSLNEVEAVLDGLSPATSEEVYAQTVDISERAIAVVAAARADAGGGGGGGTTSVELRGPYDATWESANISTTGYLLTTLEDGAILLNSYLYVTESWVSSGGVYLLLGDPLVSAANLWIQATDPSAFPADSDPGFDGGPSQGWGKSFKIGPGLHNGGVWVTCSIGVSAGALSVYLLVGTPTLP